MHAKILDKCNHFVVGKAGVQREGSEDKVALVPCGQDLAPGVLKNPLDSQSSSAALARTRTLRRSSSTVIPRLTSDPANEFFG